MGRQLSNQIDHSARTTQPVTFGGTGAQSAIGAVNALTLATEDKLGEALGIVPLDENTKVPEEYLSRLSVGNGDTIQVLENTIYAGATYSNFAFITNYDCQREYDVSGNGVREDGFLVYLRSRDYLEEGDIRYEEPGTIFLRTSNSPGPLEIYINNQTLYVDVLDPYIDAPNIYDPNIDTYDDGYITQWFYDGAKSNVQYIQGPSEGHENVGGVAITPPTFTHTYVPVDPLTIEVQFSSTIDFGFIWYEKIVNDVNSNDPQQLVFINDTLFYPAWYNDGGHTDFYIRARYRKGNLLGHWSAPAFIIHSQG